MLLGWTLLTVAIVAEVAGTMAIGVSEGFTRRPVLSAATVAGCYGTSLTCLVLLMRWQLMNLAVAYALWVALGVVLIAILSNLFLAEPMPAAKIFFIVLIIVAAAGLQLTDIRQ